VRRLGFAHDQAERADPPQQAEAVAGAQWTLPSDVLGVAGAHASGLRDEFGHGDMPHADRTGQAARHGRRRGREQHDLVRRAPCRRDDRRRRGVFNQPAH
jgi:hypothetical protein